MLMFFLFFFGECFGFNFFFSVSFDFKGAKEYFLG